MSTVPTPRSAPVTAADDEPAFLYRFWAADGELLYVGITFDPAQRWRQHRRQEWWPRVTRIAADRFDTWNLALKAESIAHRAERPTYNSLAEETRAAVRLASRPDAATAAVLTTVDRPLKTAEAARVLGLSETKLRSMEPAGILVPVRVPRSTHRRWPWPAVADLAEQLYGVRPEHPDDSPRLP